VLRSLCKNPDGLFFAGDTAQSISLGSSFRFSELQALLYRYEHRESSVQKGSRKPVKPKLFQLSVNYRSHGGIVNAASRVVELLYVLFPSSVDKLDVERGIVSII
jgi:hypothetical protein